MPDGRYAMRPRSIEAFEKAFFAYLALGIVNTLMSWRLVAAAADDPVLRAAGVGEGVVATGLLIGLLLPLLLWYFIARRASVVAKWIFVVLTAFGLLAFIQGLAAGPGGSGLTLALSTAALALQLYAAWLLFQPDAKAWFDSGGSNRGPPGPIA